MPTLTERLIGWLPWSKRASVPTPVAVEPEPEREAEPEPTPEPQPAPPLPAADTEGWAAVVAVLAEILVELRASRYERRFRSQGRLSVTEGARMADIAARPHTRKRFARLLSEAGFSDAPGDLAEPKGTV